MPPHSTLKGTKWHPKPAHHHESLFKDPKNNEVQGELCGFSGIGRKQSAGTGGECKENEAMHTPELSSKEQAWQYIDRSGELQLEAPGFVEWFGGIWIFYHFTSFALKIEKQQWWRAKQRDSFNFYQQLETEPDEKLFLKLHELQERPTKRIKYDLPSVQSDGDGDGDGDGESIRG